MAAGETRIRICGPLGSDVVPAICKAVRNRNIGADLLEFRPTSRKIETWNITEYKTQSKKIEKWEATQIGAGLTIGNTFEEEWELTQYQAIPVEPNDTEYPAQTEAWEISQFIQIFPPATVEEWEVTEYVNDSPAFSFIEEWES
jgi:hypothetical protein